MMNTRHSFYYIILIQTYFLKYIEATYQLNILFKPPIFTPEGLMDHCLQFMDSEDFDDYLTNCLLMDGLPKWKPQYFSTELNEDHVNIAGDLVSIQYRLQCYPNFYGSACKKFCKPSMSEEEGYFNCTPTGEKVCFLGYSGENCTVKNILLRFNISQEKILYLLVILFSVVTIVIVLVGLFTCGTHSDIQRSLDVENPHVLQISHRPSIDLEGAYDLVTDNSTPTETLQNQISTISKTILFA